MRFRGINYDTGTVFGTADTRPDWSDELAAAHLGTIRDELHANSILLYGTHVDRLVATTQAALDAGLTVWVQPRLPDAPLDAMLEVLASLADAVEPLRAAGGSVRLNVGCELTVFAAGIVPGGDVEQRGRRLGWLWPALIVFNRRLDRMLTQAIVTTRERFGGEVTYSAGTWETVNWQRFDAVGLNAYRDRHNHLRYRSMIERATRHGKPLLITEFGCCSYPGADRKGADGDNIIDWRNPHQPSVKGRHRRDEQVQARYVAELLDVFSTAGVDGAFVFEYSEPLYPRHADPRLDADIASFGIVAVEHTDAANASGYRETPKEAFHEIANRYRRLRNIERQDR